MNKIVECRMLTKVFDNQAKALDQVNLDIEENRIYGLLGRNGAGKTTLLKLITGQLFPTTGNVSLFGKRPHENEALLGNICFVKENAFYLKSFRDLKVKDVLKMAEAVYPSWDCSFAEQLAVCFRLDVNKKTKSLSKGMLSAAAIIIGLACRAPLTIFDEAYLGLDAVLRQQFYNTLLQDYTENPRTIIFSTHLIEECKGLMDRVVILEEGEILLHEDMDKINEKSFYVAGRRELVEQHLKGKCILHTEEMGRLVRMAIFDSLSDIEQNAMRLDGIEIQPMPLQKLFITLTAGNGGGENEQNAAAV